MDIKNKLRFTKVFSNLPLGVRKEIIYVLDKEGPVTWNVVYLEMKNDNKLGDSILKKLIELELI